MAIYPVSWIAAATALVLLSGCTIGEHSGDISQLAPPSSGQPLPSPSRARLSHVDPAPPTPHPPGTVCPTGRPPQPRRLGPDAAVTARVDAAWQRIERWLRVNAPRTYASLGPPATADEIAATERFMSVGLPADLVASLRRHGGARTADVRAAFRLPPYYVLASLDGIRTGWRTRCQIVERGGYPPGPWWHPKYVPFAESLGGDCLVVDQRPKGGGRVGEHSHEDQVFFDRRPASVAELLEATAKALEDGGPYGHVRPRAGADGVLDWEIIR
ncbi:MAG TPA: SMI1/KNR4 family protein [Micromonosporaceae bacterium]|nr:SMI1/KNR4 family protein [Micromonosporaceae bacterium]